jgi:two-component system, oxyanion-binding sensor
VSERNVGHLPVVSVGFMPLLDCALLVVAHERGFAAQQGVRLRLVREVSWANMRDRVTVGHFDAAHMLGPMVLASHLGLMPGDAACVAPVALGTGGNAIAVSSALWREMCGSGATAGAAPVVQARALARVLAARNSPDPLTLAMVFPFSCHHYQLRDWLALGGIDADRHVRLVVVPPPLLVEAIRTGQVDGFCVGEPWSSLAVHAGLGTIVAAGSDIWPDPPEKVLGMRGEYLQRNPEIVAALVRAIAAAADWAGEPAHWPQLAALLAQPRYVGAPEALLLAALKGEFALEPGGDPVAHSGFLQLNRAATRPRVEDAIMLLGRMENCGQLPADAAARTRAAACFRSDVYAAATGSPLSDARASRG